MNELTGGAKWIGFALLLVAVLLVVGPFAWILMSSFKYQIAVALGFQPVNWLGSTSIALLSVIIVDIWHWVPFVFLILFAAVEGLPVEVYEAARIDGAGRWQTFWHITLPLLMPALAVAVTFRAILAFKAFDEVFLLTSGGPGTSNELISLHIYKVFFEQNQLGYGAMLSLAVIGAIVAFLLVSRQALAGSTRV